LPTTAKARSVELTVELAHLLSKLKVNHAVVIVKVDFRKQKAAQQAKAALEASVRYLSAELGPEKQVRVNAISAGPIRTLASSAIGGILDMIHYVEEKAPLRRTVTQTEVGNTAAFLLSDLSSGISGQTIYVDAGYCINGM